MAKIVSRGDSIEPVYLNSLVVAARGWGIVSGLTVSERGAGANMSVDVAAGGAWINAITVTKGSTTNIAIATSHATYDRYDLIVINSSGTISVIEGTAGSTTYANDYDLETNNSILLAEVYVPATDTTITDNQITDKRTNAMSEYIDVANGIAGLDAAGKLPTSTLQPTIALSNSGSYVGNNTANRAIAHGLGKIPRYVRLSDSTVVRVMKIIRPGITEVVYVGTGYTYPVTVWDDTNFYIGNAANWDNSGNGSPITYTWVAIS